MKKRKILIIMLIIVIVLAIIGIKIIPIKSKSGFISVKSEKELLFIYNNNYDFNDDNLFKKIIFLPLEVIGETLNYNTNNATIPSTSYNSSENSSSVKLQPGTITSSSDTSNTKNYSTTNIQVENVDEADINKTDGSYIYSISDDKTIITNVKDPSNLKVEASLQSSEDDYVPEDLLLYNNNLIVISLYCESYSKYNTLVDIYNITNKSNPELVKSYILYEKYYTSRCIDGNLYVISSGNLRKDDNKIITYYDEDNMQKNIDLSNIKYLKDQKTKNQTLISEINLNKITNVNVKSYLFNVENTYVSNNNLYLLNDSYYSENTSIWNGIKSIFGFKGLYAGLNEAIINNDNNENQKTNIYKFNIKENGEIQYQNKVRIEGTTINQFSLDEYNENLRVGLYSKNKGSRIVIFNKKLEQIGETEYLSKNEKMYSTRFVGNKAYLVTYKNLDPLYVIDLNNPSNPQVLGKLKIPGYSTYLQPYDDTHIIGIGMQTEKKDYKDSNGRVTNTSTVITGMKMALFDISNLNNPTQISQTLIGDSNTTSAVLSNHKALLFSKEKNLIAIPVNYYTNEFSIETSSTDDISSMVSSYNNSSTNYSSEGYLVYNIDLNNGFKLKGNITHEIKSTKQNYNSYSQYNYISTRLLRGIWINNNLFTISEDMIKVNNLDDLKQIYELNLKGDK